MIAGLTPEGREFAGTLMRSAKDKLDELGLELDMPEVQSVADDQGELVEGEDGTPDVPEAPPGTASAAVVDAVQRLSDLVGGAKTVVTTEAGRLPREERGGGLATKLNLMFAGNVNQTQITGSYRSLPVRFVIEDMPSGREPASGMTEFFFARIQAKAPGTIEPALWIRRSDDAQTLAQNMLNVDGWDEDPEEVFFLAPHVYLRDRRSALRVAKTRWEQVPDTPRLLQLLEQGVVTSLKLSGGEAELFVQKAYVLGEDNLARARELLDTLLAVLETASSVWRTDGAAVAQPAG